MFLARGSGVGLSYYSAVMSVDSKLSTSEGNVESYWEIRTMWGVLVSLLWQKDKYFERE